MFWPASLYVRQRVRAASQAPGITITVLATAFSIAFPPLLPFLAGPAAPPVLAIISASVLGLALLTFVSGVIALWVADPQTYASILLAGRPADEVLAVISRHVVRSCKRTLEVAEQGRKLFGDLEARLVSMPRSLDEVERSRIDQLRQAVLRLIQKEHAPLLRIEAMKLRASKELDIPPRRLCDHVFQYSPSMHRDRLQKYLGLWGELRDLPMTYADAKFKDLAAQNNSFANNARRRIRFQEQILCNHDLHGYIVQLASFHSTSGALQTYSEALKSLANVAQKCLEHAPRKAKVRERTIEEIERQFQFLYRKQRAHPGFDLHALLLRASRLINGGAVPSPFEHLLEALGADSSFRHLLTDDVLAQFATLPAQLAALIGKSRKHISSRFESVYAEWFSDPSRPGYIVSHGYSRTVLSVLKGIRPPQGSSGHPAVPRLFFILGEEEDSFDTRVMEFELKEEGTQRRAWSFGAGSEHHLLGLLAREDAVLILLGAECFDSDRRVVHPRGIFRRLDQLVRELSERGIRSLVVVVAESYKLHGTSLTSDTTFYGQHFDRIALYDPQWIDLIVTDDTTYPERWRDVIAPRMR
ncbi:MAG TPA: hypothetical protein VGC93_11365 [Thermoanaerobaculia bacterium]